MASPSFSSARSRRQRGKQQLQEDLKAELHIHAARLRKPDGRATVEGKTLHILSPGTDRSTRSGRDEGAPKTSVRTPKQPRYNNIANYKPGYTWNRGGRLKELRIRCLARKFSQLWVTNTFGRVLPSHAKRYYERRLVRRCFGIWNELWWEERRELRLTIRADLQYKYHLNSLVFRHWRQYTLYRKGKNVQKQRADRHARQQVMVKVMAGLQVNVTLSQQKKQQQTRADRHYHLVLLRMVWCQWQEQADHSQHVLQAWVAKLAEKVCVLGPLGYLTHCEKFVTSED